MVSEDKMNIREKLHYSLKRNVNHKSHSDDYHRRITEGGKISKQMGTVEERGLLDPTSVDVKFIRRGRSPFGAYYYDELARVNSSSTNKNGTNTNGFNLNKLADDLSLSIQNADLIPKGSKMRYNPRIIASNMTRNGSTPMYSPPLVYLFLDNGEFVLDDVNDCKFAIKPGGSADYIWAFGGAEYFHGKTRNIDVFTAYLINLSDSMKK